MLLRSAEEEMNRWREHFQTVLNYEEPLNPPEVEPSDELNISTGRITRIEIKNAINKEVKKWEGCWLRQYTTRGNYCGRGNVRGGSFGLVQQDLE